MYHTRKKKFQVRQKHKIQFSNILFVQAPTSQYQYLTRVRGINLTPLRPKWGQENIVKTSLINGTSLLHTPGVHQSKFWIFFHLKNFHRQFRLCEILAVAVGQVCSGLSKPAGALLRVCLSTLVLYVFATYVSFVFCFFLCCYVFFSFCIYEISDVFFLDCFHFVFCYMYSYVLCTITCSFVCLLL